MPSNSTNIRKLQSALNRNGRKILYSTSQFYSMQQDRPITVYMLKEAVYNEETQRTHAVELFKSTSQIQILLFLRDLWYEMNGWEVPTDNPMWEDIKAKMKEKAADPPHLEKTLTLT